MQLALIALALVLAQEKVELKYQPKAGDKITLTEKTDMSLKLKMTHGMDSQDLDFAQRGSEKKTLKLEEVRDGKVVKAVYDISEDYQETKEPGAEEYTRKDGPLHGKKVTVTEKDGKPVYEGIEADPKVTKELRLLDPFSKTLPKKAVAVGDSWEVTGKDLQELINDENADGKMTLTLAGFKEVGKRRCAILEAKMDVQGKTDDGADLGMSMTGEILVSLDRGYAVSVKLSGTVTMKSDDGETKMAGEGPMTVEITADY